MHPRFSCGRPCERGQTLEFVRKKSSETRGFSHQGPSGDGWRSDQPERASRDAPGAQDFAGRFSDRTRVQPSNMPLTLLSDERVRASIDRRRKE